LFMEVLFEKKIQKLPQVKICSGLRMLAITFPVLVFLFFSFTVAAQNTIRISGQVTNELGQGVSRASISVKGSTTGTTADENGHFEITAPSDATLVISAINFTETEVAVNNRTSINVSLISLDRIGTEVIVVGYGTQRKEAVTGSVASINGDRM